MSQPIKFFIIGVFEFTVLIIPIVSVVYAFVLRKDQMQNIL